MIHDLEQIVRTVLPTDPSFRAIEREELGRHINEARQNALANAKDEFLLSLMRRQTLQDKGMKHSRGAPYHPQTQGKIERWHQTLKNRILLENYFLPGDLKAQIEAFVDHYNHKRYHESINNITPADVYFGRDKAILKQRERIKRKTLETRRLHHRQRAA